MPSNDTAARPATTRLECIDERMASLPTCSPRTVLTLILAIRTAPRAVYPPDDTSCKRAPIQRIYYGFGSSL